MKANDTPAAEIDALALADRPAKTGKKPNRKRRLLLLVLFGVLIIVGTLAYGRYFATFRFWVPPPIGEGPAGPSVPKDAFAAA